MFRNEKQIAEKALLGWSMLDHDDAARLDINDFDECSPLPRLSANVHRGYSSPSLSGSSPIAEQRSKKATAAGLPGGRREPARQVAAPGDPLGDLPKVAVPVSLRAPVQNSTLCTTSCVTNDWSTRFVGSVTQIGARGQSARKKRRHTLGHQCFIDESSSDDSSADTSRIKDTASGTCTEIEEVTEDELNNSVDQLREPRLARVGTVSSTIQDSDCSTDTSVGDAENTLQKQDVVKNGFEELLLIARQKEMSELALWECYKKNVDFPKTFSEALTARVVTLEDVCGLVYCVCELVGLPNATSNVCVTLPVECAEREHIESGVVMRIYPPWREYMIPSCREKLISGVQFFEVVERPSSGTV